MIASENVTFEAQLKDSSYHGNTLYHFKSFHNFENYDNMMGLGRVVFIF